MLGLKNIERELFRINNEEKCKIIEDVSNKLQLSIKSFKASYHELMSEQFLLAT